MTNTNPLNIKDFDKVCKVSSLISQICKIAEVDWFEKILLKEWEKIVNEKYEYAVDDDEVCFILAKYAFIDYLRSDKNTMRKYSTSAFLADMVGLV